MRSVGEQQQFVGPLAGGVAAGLASSLVRVPTEVVKTRMQTGGWRRPRAWVACMMQQAQGAWGTLCQIGCQQRRTASPSPC